MNTKKRSSKTSSTTGTCLDDNSSLVLPTGHVSSFIGNHAALQPSSEANHQFKETNINAQQLGSNAMNHHSTTALANDVNNTGNNQDNPAMPQPAQPTWGTKVNRKYRQLRKTLKTCKHFEDNYFVLELNNAQQPPPQMFFNDHHDHAKPHSQSSQKPRRKKASQQAPQTSNSAESSPDMAGKSSSIGLALESCTAPSHSTTTPLTQPTKKAPLTSVPYQGQVQMMGEFSVARPGEDEVVPLSIINRSEEMEQRNMMRTPNSSTSGSSNDKSHTGLVTRNTDTTKKRKTKDGVSKNEPVKKKCCKKTSVDVHNSNVQSSMQQVDEHPTCTINMMNCSGTIISSNEDNVRSSNSTLLNSQPVISTNHIFGSSHNSHFHNDDEFMMARPETSTAPTRPSSTTTKITVNPNHNFISFSSSQPSPRILPFPYHSSSSSTSPLPSSSVTLPTMTELPPFITELTNSIPATSENKLPSLNSIDSFFKADLTDESILRTSRSSQERLLQRNSSTISDFLRLEDIPMTNVSSNSSLALESKDDGKILVESKQAMPLQQNSVNSAHSGFEHSSSNCLLKRNPSGGLPRSMSHGSLSLLDTSADDDDEDSESKNEAADDRSSSHFSRSTSSDSMRQIPSLTVLQPFDLHEMQSIETVNTSTSKLTEPITTTAAISPSLTKEVVIERDKILVKSPFITPLNSVLYKNISVSNMDLVKMDVPSVETFKKPEVVSPEKDHSHWLQQIHMLPSNDSLTRIPSIDFEIGPGEKK
ncbi:hypothetical protein C9374_011147 [Naegleria lovaniensis]|uniref:Uncharacterized protein n=1 Tax=Naegleria lovaniensis TaxID=51637 RepID=A0AA88GFR8_NAELO|nr:uncharacterized protein C9374_011147 [Naegleria lovaniensis]KAG2374068.1 hypothetical protein C9374_011147 [Naegleria lovaniensis]